jgi:hypothetical protein
MNINYDFYRSADVPSTIYAFAFALAAAVAW